MYKFYDDAIERTSLSEYFTVAGVLVVLLVAIAVDLSM